MNNNINIIIDNKELEVKNNYNIIQACNENNINIPKFCYHQELSIAGNCRMCLVEVKGVNKPIASCAIPVTPGMVIYTNSKLVKKAREGVLEFILINHPLDCPICDQGGECDLQDQSLVFGSDRGRFYEYKRSVNDKDCGPFIKTIMTRCIHCTRCIRFLDEVAGFKYLGLIGRGTKIEISNYINKIIYSELSGNIVDLCPVGALTLKSYSFKARPWELNYFNSIDLFDPFHLNIRIDIRDLKILRILPVFNNILKENWISDITRYAYDGFNNFRLLNPLSRNDEGKFLSLSWLKTYELVSKLFISNNINFILGNFIDMETCFILKKIKSLNSKRNHVTLNINNNYNIFNNLDFRNNYFMNNSNIQNLLEYDNIVLVDSNIRLSNPLLNLRIKNFCKIKNHVFTIGSSFYSNFLVHNYGSNLKELWLLFKGQSELNLILKNKKNLLIINESSIMSDNLSLNFIMLLKNIKKYIDLDFFFFNNTNSDISLFKEINISGGAVSKFNDKTFKPLEQISNNIFYFLNTSQKFIFNKGGLSNYFIYQGSNYNISNKSYYNLLLPSVNHLEKNSSYVNFLGYYQRSKFILYPPKNSRSDWKILYILFNFLFKDKSKIKFSDFSGFRINYNLFYNDSYFNMTNIRLNKLFNYNFKISNNFYNDKYVNIYKSNSIILSSKNIFSIFKKIKESYSNFY
uniref:NADH-ubiquinone oxidoreductase 75 kDa subunit n=1 Tax=Paramoeba pemaquidensis TaxID=180228 RepID=A0A1D8D5F4_9EUKA|nr:NADH dehydrogenase 11 [Paramoeba pemaquidensis]AOS85545.1 NADH dehydrogenase 11 [Paramoeba pemaquidensis]